MVASAALGGAHHGPNASAPAPAPAPGVVVPPAAVASASAVTDSTSALGICNASPDRVLYEQAWPSLGTPAPQHTIAATSSTAPSASTKITEVAAPSPTLQRTARNGSSSTSTPASARGLRDSWQTAVAILFLVLAVAMTCFLLLAVERGAPAPLPPPTAAPVPAGSGGRPVRARDLHATGGSHRPGRHPPPAPPPPRHHGGTRHSKTTKFVAIIVAVAIIGALIIGATCCFAYQRWFKVKPPTHLPPSPPPSPPLLPPPPPSSPVSPRDSEGSSFFEIELVPPRPELSISTRRETTETPQTVELPPKPSPTLSELAAKATEYIEKIKHRLHSSSSID